MTFGINNEGYIEKKSFDNWQLYTQVGEKIAYGLKKNYSSRYKNFRTFDNCIEQLQILGGEQILIKICEFEEYQSINSSANTLVINTNES